MWKEQFFTVIVFESKHLLKQERMMLDFYRITMAESGILVCETTPTNETICYLLSYDRLDNVLQK
jgi:hypothetical protein